jgi:hypothetical protein
MSSRFTKTPKLNIVLQVTETSAPGMDGRAWEVHDVERNRGFRVSVPGASLRPTRGRAPSDEEIDGAMGLAIERALVTPPEKVSGTLYDVAITSQDLQESAKLGRS